MFNWVSIQKWYKLDCKGNILSPLFILLCAFLFWPCAGGHFGAINVPKFYVYLESGEMVSNWDYQIRITLTDESARKYRQTSSAKEFSPLNSLLARYSATLKSQFDAFSEYVSTAETEGAEQYALYQWTKDTIEDPEKKSKYLKSFTIYVLDEQIYSGDVADALEKDLRSLRDSDFILGISKYDTNPANNPQMPAKYRT